MTTDTIPQSASRLVRTLAAPHRFRVARDAEGWPVIPGRQGTIEFHCDGVDCHGCPEGGVLLAVWTDRPRLFAKLWAIPGVRRWQIGDGEMRALFPPEALDQVAGVIPARRRKQITAEHLEKLRGGLLAAGSGPEDDEEPVDEGGDSGLDEDRDGTGPYNAPGAEAPPAEVPLPELTAWIRATFRKGAAPPGEESEAWGPGVRVVREPRPPGWPALRTEVLKRDGYQCRRCRTRHGPWTVHHVIPRTAGGSDDPRNLVTLCIPCHDAAEVQAERGGADGQPIARPPSRDPASARGRGAVGSGGRHY